MPVIGTFSAVKDGYAGTIRTLALNIKVQLIANDRREADGAADFRIMAGNAEIGAAWRRPRRSSDETYLSIRPRPTRAAGLRVMDIPGRARAAPKSRLGLCRHCLSSSVRGSRCHPVDHHQQARGCVPRHPAARAGSPFKS
jgi:uncharacterized protein (DUF736 family)